MFAKIQFANLVCFPGGNFWLYGVDHSAVSNGISIGNLIFPLVAKCQTSLFSEVKSVNQKFAMCDLLLNVWYVEIFVLVWFFLVFLMVASIVGLTYRFVLFRDVHFRALKLHYSFNLVAKPKCIVIAKNTSFGAWLVIHQVGKNVSIEIFDAIITKLHDKITNREAPANAAVGDTQA